MLYDMPQRFYCSVCRRERGQKVRGPHVAVTEEQPDKGKQFPYPDERTWKRLVSRYRS